MDEIFFIVQETARRTRFALKAFEDFSEAQAEVQRLNRAAGSATFYVLEKCSLVRRDRPRIPDTRGPDLEIHSYEPRN